MHCGDKRPHLFIQCFLMNTVGTAITLAIPMISTAHIFHTALAVPAADHRNERIPTFPAGQQSRIAVLGPIAVCGSCLPLEPSEEVQRKRLERVANEISGRGETDEYAPLDLFHPSEADLEKGDAFYYEMLRAIGPTKDAWRDYKKRIRRYETYLHDIRAFNGTIRNFIRFSLSKLKHNSPEDYAAALYGFYNDERIAEKLIINPIRNSGDCYRTHDDYALSYVPRQLPDGSVAICQEHVTDSLQALMKADYMLALNSGHNIRRCIICGRYFLLKSGVHALYCEGECPHAPGYTCRQFGTVEMQKELAKDIPKVKVKVTAFSRITKDMQRGAISQEDARKAKDYVRDLLYDALRDADTSVDAFEQSISSEHVYQNCGITRTANPRGRPPKARAGDAP